MDFFFYQMLFFVPVKTKCTVSIGVKYNIWTEACHMNKFIEDKSCNSMETIIYVPSGGTLPLRARSQILKTLSTAPIRKP